jgi:hypothetical protein
MAKRGLVGFDRQAGKPRLESMDHKFAYLVRKFMTDGEGAGIMKPQPALHRVIPAQNTMKSEWTLPYDYDDVRAILLVAKRFVSKIATVEWSRITSIVIVISV